MFLFTLLSIVITIGKPRCGVEFENMKRDKLRYKLPIKNKERLSANWFSDSLNDALSMKDMDSFGERGNLRLLKVNCLV